MDHVLSETRLPVIAEIIKYHLILTPVSLADHILVCGLTSATSGSKVTTADRTCKDKPCRMRSIMTLHFTSRLLELCVIDSVIPLRRNCCYMEWLFYRIPFTNIPSSSTPTYDPGADFSLSVISDVNARIACCNLPRMSSQVDNSSCSSKSM